MTPAHTNRKGLRMVSDILPNELANAKLLGKFDTHSPEWHDARRTRIGGSEVGAIVGESKYETAYSLWAKKTGRIEADKSDNDFMYWGRSLEPVIIDRFELEHPELEVHRDCGTWVNKEREWQVSNPDGILLGDRGYGILEIKTARYEDDWRDGVPKYYMTQVQWYLNTFGFDYAYIVCLFSGSNYQEFPIKADKAWQEHDLASVETFRQHLIDDTKPDWDGASATYEAVREQYLSVEETSVELGQIALEWDKAKKAVDDAKSELNLKSSEILEQMGEAKYGTLFGEIYLTRQKRAGQKPFLAKKRGQ